MGMHPHIDLNILLRASRTPHWSLQEKHSRRLTQNEKKRKESRRSNRTITGHLGKINGPSLSLFSLLSQEGRGSSSVSEWHQLLWLSSRLSSRHQLLWLWLCSAPGNDRGAAEGKVKKAKQRSSGSQTQPVQSVKLCSLQDALSQELTLGSGGTGRARPLLRTAERGGGRNRVKATGTQQTSSNPGTKLLPA